MFGLTLSSPRTTAPLDESLLWSAILLLAFGLVMVYSASIATAEASRLTGFDPTYYLVRHAAFLVVGLAAAYAAFQVPIRWWQQGAPYLFIIAAALLLLVLIPGIGRVVNGSQRWLRFAGLGFQPSEFAKLAAVLYAADYTVRKAAFMGSFRKGFLPMAMVMLLSGTLLLLDGFMFVMGWFNRAQIDEVDYGALMLGDGGHVHWLNHAARAALGREHPLVLQGRQLRARLPQDVAPLAEALQGAQRGLRSRPGGSSPARRARGF